MSLGDTATAFTHFMNINKYFNKVYSIDNSTSSVEEQFKVFATKFDTTNNRDVVDMKSIYVFIPQTPEAYTYDADGNITSDGKQNYTYNCENRLVTVEKTDDYKLEFKYDYLGRRIEKKVYSWVSSAWQLDTQLKFIYDGFKLIAETDAQNGDAVVRKYVWNGEIPVSMTDADGTFFYVLDGNKNVTELIDSTGATRAHYEYSPFGKVIIKTGDKADDNPIRFSSEYFDTETGLVYYNFRYYNPETARWLNRDPIMEAGGFNLYAMVSNDPINSTDVLGLCKCDCAPPINPKDNHYHEKIVGIIRTGKDGNPHLQGSDVTGAIDNLQLLQTVSGFGEGLSSAVNVALYLLQFKTVDLIPDYNSFSSKTKDAMLNAINTIQGMIEDNMGYNVHLEIKKGNST